MISYERFPLFLGNKLWIAMLIPPLIFYLVFALQPFQDGQESEHVAQVWEVKCRTTKNLPFLC